jgi:hypothetical protein
VVASRIDEGLSLFAVKWHVFWFLLDSTECWKGIIADLLGLVWIRRHGSGLRDVMKWRRNKNDRMEE